MRIERRWEAGTAGATLATILLILAIAGPSSAEPAANSGSGLPAASEGDLSSGLTPVEEDAQIAQAPYMALAEAVAELDMTLGEEHLGNLVAIDVASGTVDVAWVGDVPHELLALAQTAAQNRIVLDIEPARNTVSEMRTIAQDISRSEGIGPVSVALGTDALTVESTSLAADARKAGQGRSIGQEAQQFFDRVAKLETEHGVRVEFTAEGPTEQLATRASDTNNFLGGQFYRPAGGTSQCTSGFQAQIGSAKYFLTAAHCSNFANGTSTYNYYNGYIGSTQYIDQFFWNRPDPYDLALVALSSILTGQSRIYNDPMLPGTLGVQNVAPSIVMNATYCSSGSHTGARCNVYSTGQSLITPVGTPAFWVVTVTSTNGRLWCQGDSGGPVYY